MAKGTLYLIPNTLGESLIEDVIPSGIKTILPTIDYYIVEHLKTARRHLKKIDRDIDIDRLIFFELNTHTLPNDKNRFIQPLTEGKNIGLISDAGCPGIADPGAEIVALAHKNNFRVIPFVGPSSIFLALMASGMNGQNFCFHGYLPKERTDRIKFLKQIETNIRSQQQTQICIETPFRNEHLLEDILKNCAANTILGIAVDITLPSEEIVVKPIREWKKNQIKLDKRPAIFLLGTFVI